MVLQKEKRKYDETGDEKTEWKYKRAAELLFTYVQSIRVVCVQLCDPEFLAMLSAEFRLIAKVFNDGDL